MERRSDSVEGQGLGASGSPCSDALPCQQRWRRRKERFPLDASSCFAHSRGSPRLPICGGAELPFDSSSSDHTALCGSVRRTVEGGTILPHGAAGEVEAIVRFARVAPQHVKVHEALAFCQRALALRPPGEPPRRLPRRCAQRPAAHTRILTLTERGRGEAEKSLLCTRRLTTTLCSSPTDPRATHVAPNNARLHLTPLRTGATREDVLGVNQPVFIRFEHRAAYLNPSAIHRSTRECLQTDASSGE